MLKKLFGLGSKTEGNSRLDEENSALRIRVNSLSQEKFELEEIIQNCQSKISQLEMELAAEKEKNASNVNSNNFDSNMLTKLEVEIKNRDLKIKSLIEQNERIKNTVIGEIDKENIANTEISKDIVNYRLMIDLVFKERKFTQFKKKCSEMNIRYFDQLDSVDFEDFGFTKTKTKNTYEYYEFIKDNNYDEEMKLYLLKGGFVKDVFPKHRKFKEYCAEKNIKYMIDLEKFDFNLLVNAGYDEDQITKLKKIYYEFESVRRVGFNPKKIEENGIKESELFSAN